MLFPASNQHRRHRGFKVGRCQVVQSRVQPLPVVDLLDEASDRAARLVRGPVGAPIDLSRFSVLMKLSALALSYGEPTRLMLGWMPWAASSALYSAQAYCTPRSE